MNLKNSIILTVTIIYILLSILFIIFQIFELKEIQNNDTNLTLEKIVKEIKNMNEIDIKEETINSLKPELFFTIWLKIEDKWIPIIYDRNIEIHNINNPLNIPSSIVDLTRTYLKNIDNFQFIVWINKFAKEYYIKNIFLPILVLIFIYLFITFIINLIFYPIKGVNYFAQDEYEETYNNYNDIEITTNEESDILKEYKELWKKNYKISEDFKNNFPFRKIYDLITKF